MTTNLTTAQINIIAAELTGTEAKGTATKDRAIAKLRAAISGIVGEANAEKATAAILACENAEHASKAVRSILEEVMPKPARRSSAKAALRLVEGAAPVEKPKRERKDAAEPKATGKRAAILAAAQDGILPAAPDFTANTHKPFRKKLEAVVALVEAGDIAALRAFAIKPISSSPKAIAKYRDLAVIALEARAAKATAA